jgi:hypothetical protein
MIAMAAIVAQNGATGQSLVEQFTTGNLKLAREILVDYSIITYDSIGISLVGIVDYIIDYSGLFNWYNNL